MTHREKSCSKGKMQQFCDLASKENLLSGDFMELQEMLQEISNMESRDNTVLPMRCFLGHRTIIGGTFGNRWNRAKMENFLLHVNCWNGLQKGVRSFRNNHWDDLTSNDIRHQGHNGGSIRGVQIYQIGANGGRLPVTPRSSFQARNIALTTPRKDWKEAAARSVGSTPLNSPRGRESLASSSSSVGSAPLNSPRGHLCTPPPLKSLLLEWFMAKCGECFNAAMDEVCKGLTCSSVLLVQIYDVVRLHQMFFRDMTLNNPVTQKLFFERLSNCVLIQRTLQASLLFRSIEHVAFTDPEIQVMFIEGLIFSFFQACRKTISTLGISKIVPKPDGDSFSIELFPDEMIQDYIRRFQPSTKGELPSMA